MDTGMIAAIFAMFIGGVFCIALVLLDKWLRKNNIKTRFVPSFGGILFFMAMLSLAARITLVLEPEDATLIVGVLAIANISVLATAIECSAIDE